MHLTCRRARPGTGDLFSWLDEGERFFSSSKASPSKPLSFRYANFTLPIGPSLFHHLYIVIDSGRSLVVEHHIDPVVGALKLVAGTALPAAVVVPRTPFRQHSHRPATPAAADYLLPR